MKRAGILFLLSGLLVSGLLLSCQKTMYELANPIPEDGKYDTIFPRQEIAGMLEDILGSLYSINSVAYYSGFVFSEDSRITLQDIHEGSFQKRAVRTVVYNTSVLGTATVLSSNQRQVALLTCAHVLSFPDTSIRYFREESSQNPTQFVRSVAFKVRQHNFIPQFSRIEGQNLRILAVDSRNDLALVGGVFTSSEPRNIPVFPFRFGKTANLQWGSRVFIAGFPKGKKMVTSGMVSQPHLPSSQQFLVDAFFNRGMSGGVVVAVRDGLPNVELVGLASAASGEYTNLLVPEEEWETTLYDPSMPYTGDAYVKLQKKIDYGITYTIPVDSIRSFIRSNLQTVLREGYDLRPVLQAGSEENSP